MIVTFCGHSKFLQTDNIRKKLAYLLESQFQDKAVTFYVGTNGEFDRIAYSCCKEYCKKNNNANVYRVTPYNCIKKQKNNMSKDSEDYIYPPIENTPIRFAIVARNRWMVDNADLVIAYVIYTWGGAYKTLSYAKSKNKKFILIEE